MFAIDIITSSNVFEFWGKDYELYFVLLMLRREISMAFRKTNRGICEVACDSISHFSKFFTRNQDFINLGGAGIQTFQKKFEFFDNFESSLEIPLILAEVFENFQILKLPKIIQYFLKF